MLGTSSWKNDIQSHFNGHCLPKIGSSCNEEMPHGLASGPTIMSLLIVQTGKLIAVEIRKLVLSACECSLPVCHDSFTYSVRSFATY